MKDIFNFLPFKLKKRINKTGEGRSGLEIYKRRNRRDYRVIVQYSTWKKLMNLPLLLTPEEYFKLDENARLNLVVEYTEKDTIIYPDLLNFTPVSPNTEYNILPEFLEGYAVLITPKEYFGSSYPSRSTTLDDNFILGTTGFVYYSTIDEYNNYLPLNDWKEVYELSTIGNQTNMPKTWYGDYVLNIKNSSNQRISPICKNRNSQNIEEIQIFFDAYFPEILKCPAQAGLGNYDYDYASPEIINLVKMQMLFLALSSKEEDGISFEEYIKNNSTSLSHVGDSAIYKRYLTSDEYLDDFRKTFTNFKLKCQRKGLLNYEKLFEIGAWDIINNLPICPLCGKPIHPHEFFEEIEQTEGRQVSDNTQRAIVLMHIEALRPGKLNHRPYNLGWGHNFCNTIQGDKDISETIEELRKIIVNYEEHHKK
ncbi:BstXI family restriction endonuclease [Fusobacterium ulcerans]|uniref:Uncharacterized protein n=1 Tax=Fusobacterium ulcerans 12-1B TaxID=457404 RepID=H1PPC9_9FUSO|nr:BstXI family restriction endonuclease [Fusobacterium ulcerans]EHO84453.1 hypothetical protein HMPREF0402_00272 [Fusobacterium ulcerans 12-1B]